MQALQRNRTVRPMDVLAPRTLAEALRLKAEHPDAQPIQGGTDLMVALNFDRARPPKLLDLNGVAELRGWSRENGSLRLGSGASRTVFNPNFGRSNQSCIRLIISAIRPVRRHASNK